MTHQSQTQFVSGPAGKIAVHTQGSETGPAVILTHSILSSSMMWLEQAYLLSSSGWRVIAIDTRGHGQSECQSVMCTMDDLVADTLAVMDAMNISKAHYMGLSLGGMSGVGLGIQHADRLLSMVLCDCRADMPSRWAMFGMIESRAPSQKVASHWPSPPQNDGLVCPSLKPMKWLEKPSVKPLQVPQPQALSAAPVPFKVSTI